MGAGPWTPGAGRFRSCRERAAHEIGRQRHRQGEPCALADDAVAVDDALVLLDDPVGDGQPEARATADGLGREKRIVDPGKLLGWDPRASIGNFHHDAAGFHPARDRQPAAAWHRVARVEEQVQEHLLELVLDAEHRDGKRGELPPHSDSPDRELMLEQGEDVTDHRVQVH